MSTDARPVVGFIGLGRMGGAMVGHIAAAGFTVRAFDIDPAALARAVDTGAVAARSAADAAGQAEIVMTSLPSSAVTVAVTERELLPGARPSQVYVDMGTTVAVDTRRLAAAFAAAGAAYLDAPVSGEPGPSMRVFVGGDRAAFERCRPVLEATADPRRVVYCGPSGTGQAVKACNQLGMGLVDAAFVEAVFAGIAAGADVDAIIRGVGGGDGWRRRLAEVAALARDGRADEVLVKFPELPYFIAEAKDRGYRLPLTEALYAFLEPGPRNWVDNMNRPRVAFWHQLMQAKARGGDGR